MWTLHSGLPHTFSIFGYGKLIYFLWFISIINLAAVKTASDVQGRKEAMYSVDATQRKGEEPRSVLTFLSVRTGGVQGNQIHSSNIWTLGIPKMYMRPLGYNVQISLKNSYLKKC